MLTNCEAFNKVLEACRQHRHEFAEWHRDGFVELRFIVNGTTYCPITLATKHFHRVGWSPSQYVEAAKDLGIDPADAHLIASAADGRQLDRWDVLQLRDAIWSQVESPNLLPAVVEEHVNAD